MLIIETFLQKCTNTVVIFVPGPLLICLINELAIKCIQMRRIIWLGNHRYSHEPFDITIDTEDQVMWPQFDQDKLSKRSWLPGLHRKTLPGLDPVHPFWPGDRKKSIMGSPSLGKMTTWKMNHWRLVVARKFFTLPLLNLEDKSLTHLKMIRVHLKWQALNKNDEFLPEFHPTCQRNFRSSRRSCLFKTCPESFRDTQCRAFGNPFSCMMHGTIISMYQHHSTSMYDHVWGPSQIFGRTWIWKWWVFPAMASWLQ